METPVNMIVGGGTQNNKIIRFTTIHSKARQLVDAQYAYPGSD